MRRSTLRTRGYRAAVDDASTKYEAAVQDAIDETAAPEAARCYICLDGGDLIRNCACRGPDQGFAHAGCLVRMAESHLDENAYVNNPSKYFQALNYCGLCRHSFEGKVYLALCRAAWQRFVVHPADDVWRANAITKLGVALHNMGRIDEAERLFAQSLEITRRVYGRDHHITKDVERLCACSIHANARGDVTKLKKALDIFTRLHAWHTNHVGPDDGDTLKLAKSIGSVKRDMGMFAESQGLFRDHRDAVQRVFGESSERWIEAQRLLAYTFWIQGKYRECYAICEPTLATAERVLGPDGWETTRLRHMSRQVGRAVWPPL